MLTSQSKSLLTYFVAYFVCIVLLSCLSSFLNIVFLSEINKTLLNDSISVAASGPEGLGKPSVHRQVHHLPVKTHDEKENNLSFPGVDQYTQHIISRFGMKSLNNSAIKPIRPEFGQVINDINFQYLINPSDRCSEIHSVFIIVISAPSYWNKRQLIRQTWASTTFEKRRDLNWSANYAFLIGSTSRQEMQDHIDEESADYQDIIQVDLVDSYKNLTLKSIALLHWANQHCLNNLRFVLKCDDDIFINTLYLESTLQRLPKNLPAIYGSANINIKPRRSPGDKWRLSRKVWPWSNYPPYITGGAYLMDKTAVAPLLAAAQTIPYLHIEDIYLSGLCARKAGVELLVSYRMLSLISDEVSYDLMEEAWLINNTVMWLTSSDLEMISSHLAVEYYFNFKISKNLKKLLSSRQRKSFFPKIKWTVLQFQMTLDELEKANEIEY